MRFRTASSGKRISSAATRPLPAAVGINAWVQIPCRVPASWTRTCSCWAAGKASMMRSTVLGALCVCTRLLGQSVQNGRNAKLLERLDVSRDEAESGAERAALEEDVDAEAGQAGNRVGQVDVAIDL